MLLANLGRPRKPSRAPDRIAEPVMPDAVTASRQLEGVITLPVREADLPGLRRLQRFAGPAAEALLDGDLPSPGVLNELAGQSSARIRLTAAGGSLRQELAWDDGSVVAQLARRLIGELADLESARLRRCAREQCGLNRYPTQVSSKRRSSAKRTAHRQGLSGNPQRRARQLGQDRRAGPEVSAFGNPLTDRDRATLRDMAYRLAGGALTEAWWRGSHGRILARARALTWPTRLVDVETLTCRIVGDEFYDRLQSPATGLHPAQWLRALAEATGTALDTTPDQDTDDWPKLWALLCGLALTTPSMPPAVEYETLREQLPEFPDIKDPLETALAQAERFAKLAADRGIEPDPGYPAGGSTAGEPLVAGDVYGSRRLVLAPFSYDGGAPDHWYAWDIDLCWLAEVVGAGAFATADDALSEWREAVGAPASGAELSPCPAGMTAALLGPSLRTGFMADMLRGNEPRGLIREYYRLRRRARDLTGSADAPADPSSFDAGRAPEAFLDWYAARHDDVPAAVTEAAATIHEEWGHTYPDERSFYACSPHRIEMAAHLMRNSYEADYANPALRLLPEWTQWCIERTGLDGDDGDAAARSREAARSAASALVHEEDDEPAAEDEAPFRRQE